MDPGTPVSELSVGLCQMVEIAKAVSKNASILVFDEPSAALSDSETEFLFKMIRQLKEEGVSMVYISHRMNEILEICDRVTVIRDGKKVITEKVENLTMEEIVAQMMGNEAKETKFEYVPREYDRNAEDLLTVKHLKINDKIDDINFSIKPGQILGLAGLMGAGRTEIMETLFGLRKAVSGSIELEGKKVEIKNPSDAVACGFALVPEDRRKEGLVLSHTIKENAILPISAQLVKNGIFNDDKAAHDIVEKNIQDLGVVADNMNQEIRLLSGGNQQKIVIAKWLNSNPKIFMFDEPTAGVDIVAKGEIISIIREFADHLMIVMSVVMVGMSYQMPVSVGVIQGGGDTKFQMYMNLISTWGIVMPLSFLAAFVWKLPVEWVVVAVQSDQLFKCVPVFLRFRSYKWIRKLT